MKIAGYDYLAEQNNRITRDLQDFSTNTRVSENLNVTPATKPEENVAIKPAEDKDASLKISGEGFGAVRAIRNQQQTAANTYAAINFSTKPEIKTAESNVAESNNTVNNSKVLDQYRFFVQPTQYEGNEGVVRRIFG